MRHFLYEIGLDRSNLVTAVRLIRRMRGGSQSVLVLCDDEQYYVLKMAGNPQGPGVLANEWLGTALASVVGLPVAIPTFVVVSDSFLRENPELSFATRSGHELPRAGVHFGSRLVGQVSGPDRPVEYLSGSEAKRVANRRSFVGMYVFDMWANHQDNRQAMFLRNSENNSLEPVFIDHGHLFGGPYWIFHERKCVARYNDASVYSGQWSSRAVSSWIGILQERIPSKIPLIADQIPSDWYGGDLSSLISTLLTRLDLLPRLSEFYAQWGEASTAGTLPNDRLRVQGP